MGLAVREGRAIRQVYSFVSIESYQLLGDSKTNQNPLLVSQKAGGEASISSFIANGIICFGSDIQRREIKH